LSQEQVPFKVHARGSIGVAFGLMPRGEMQTERGRVITRTSMPFFSKEGHAGSGQRLTRDKKAAWVLHYAAAAATRFPQHSITEKKVFRRGGDWRRFFARHYGHVIAILYFFETQISRGTIVFRVSVLILNAQGAQIRSTHHFHLNFCILHFKICFSDFGVFEFYVRNSRFTTNFLSRIKFD
jgi:hypothetical protein